uniref:PARG catalytic Macro domain-containing protein n=1 Tax=Arcella intermedia TaxID=1963864 RepID=A0A6B2LJ08_9EUKA
MVGGGVLEDGVGQEEHLFMEHPECIASRLFVARLADEDALIIRNAVRVRGGEVEVGTEKVCVDALPFTYARLLGLEEYSEREVRREVNKRLVGMGNRAAPVVVTGKWGCGSFGGTFELKLVIQWIGCSLCGMEGQVLKWNRDWNSERENEVIGMLVEFMREKGNKLTIKQVADALLDCVKETPKNPYIVKDIIKKLQNL